MAQPNNDNNTLAHTTWNCKYHIVFAPKYRRKVFFGEKRTEIREILRQLCQWKGVEIIEGEVCPDHIHNIGKYPTKDKCKQLHGISERKKQPDDISKIWKHEVCI